MEFLARFASPIVAEHAASYLRANGVQAHVVGHLDVLSGVSPSLFHDGGQFIVVIADAQDREMAQLLLEEMADEPMELEEDLESAARIDLASLPGDLAPVCPGCGVVLALDQRVHHCPSCGTSVDIEALIVDQHGPDAIADALEAALHSGAERLCPACGGRLAHDGAEACPACDARADRNGPDQMEEDGRT